MPLFPLDAVRNARPDRSLEPLLEDLREAVTRYGRWEAAGVGSAAEVLEAFDQARPRLNVLATLLSHCGVRSCVDVSTGLGFLPGLLTRLGLRALATERQLAIAAFAQDAGVDVLPYTIGGGSMPFQPESADAVVFAEVLEHLKVPPLTAITEVAGILRRGGVFLLTTPNIARLEHLEALAAGENFLEAFPEDIHPGDDPTDHVEHVREYSIREVVEAAEAAGLEVQQVVMTGWGDAGYHPLPNPYANQIIVLQAAR
jgi:SAM-dependent methyltransferase